MTSTLYSCGCVSSVADQNYCIKHGRQFIIRSSESMQFKKRKFIREYVDFYLCQPKSFDQAFKHSDLVIVDSIEDLSSAELESYFAQSKARCIIIDSTSLSKETLANKALPTLRSLLVATTLLHSTKVLELVDFHDVVNGNEHSQYNTNTVILLNATALELGRIHNLMQLTRTERGVGVLFEKFVLSQLKHLKLKRVVHVNAKTLRWMKAVKDYAPYTAQTVNPLLYRLMIDNEKLDNIRLFDEGVSVK